MLKILRTVLEAKGKSKKNNKILKKKKKKKKKLDFMNIFVKQFIFLLMS